MKNYVLEYLIIIIFNNFFLNNFYQTLNVTGKVIINSMFLFEDFNSVADPDPINLPDSDQ